MDAALQYETDNVSDQRLVSTCKNRGDVVVTGLTGSGHFEGGKRGNAVPIVKIPLERVGTAFPLLSYAENA